MVRELLRTNLLPKTTTKCFTNSEGRIGVPGQQYPEFLTDCSITEKKHLSLQQHAVNVIIMLNRYGSTLLRAELLLGSPSVARATLGSTALYVVQHHVLLLV